MIAHASFACGQAGWPPHVAQTVKDVCLSAGNCLLHQRPRKRIELAAALRALAEHVEGAEAAPGALPWPKTSRSYY